MVASTACTALRVGTWPLGPTSLRANFIRQCTRECWLYWEFGPPRSLTGPCADVNTSDEQAEKKDMWLGESVGFKHGVE